ncbi:MAG: rRNA maturation RNase YbeY [Pseudomonadota bacterium]
MGEGLDDEPDSPALPTEAQLRKWLETTLRTADGPREAELTVRLVDAAESARLNGDYRGRPRATNVLSFPFEAPPGLDQALGLLGDLVVCAPVVVREAAEQDKTVEAHSAHMVVHGALHLLGHDHQDKAEAETMEGLERRILAALGYPDPYPEDETVPTHE